MTGQGQGQVIGRDPPTIVANPQQLDPTLLDIDINAPSAGVQAVLQQLLDDRGRALDDFTRGNLVRQARAEQFDARAAVHRVVHSLAASSVPGMFRCWPIFSSSDCRLLALRKEAADTW